MVHPRVNPYRGLVQDFKDIKDILGIYGESAVTCEPVRQVQVKEEEPHERRSKGDGIPIDCASEGRKAVVVAKKELVRTVRMRAIHSHPRPFSASTACEPERRQLAHI
jgi:hypothetical protein